jgi:hypothetical protein
MSIERKLSLKYCNMDSHCQATDLQTRPCKRIGTSRAEISWQLSRSQFSAVLRIEAELEVDL